MKKLFLASLVLFFTEAAFSYDAIVIVFEAPLLKEPSLNSKVLQTLKKGSRVYVPNELGNRGELPDFVQTYDRVGNTVYIPAKYIKVITNDLTENETPIAYPKHDPTDYRLEEPIPSTYPFDNTSFFRVSVALSLGSNTKSPYSYNSTFARQDFSEESGARFNLTKKVQFDNYDRFYFGIFGAITTCNNSINFQNNNYSKENRSLIRVGPVATYDFFKSSHYRMSLGTGFTYNYHKSSLKMSAPNGDSEERLFTGYSLSPFASSVIQMMDVFPETDLIGGADFNLFLPHSQKSSDAINVPTLWGANATNQISAGAKPQVSFFIGAQVKY